MSFTRRNNGLGRVQLDPGGPSLTKQSEAMDCDVNVIIARYTKTADPSLLLQNVGGIYADVSAIGDFATCQQIIRNAQEAFDALPAEIRDYFRNDPALLAGALDDPEMRSELERLGILEPKPSGTPSASAPTDGPENSSSPAPTAKASSPPTAPSNTGNPPAAPTGASST